MVARHADAWHAFGNVDTLAHKSRVLDDWCAEIGRDPSEIERSTGVRPGLDNDQREALYGLGFRQFAIGLSGPDYDLSAVPDWLAWRDRVRIHDPGRLRVASHPNRRWSALLRTWADPTAAVSLLTGHG